MTAQNGKQVPQEEGGYVHVSNYDSLSRGYVTLIKIANLCSYITIKPYLNCTFCYAIF